MSKRYLGIDTGTIFGYCYIDFKKEYELNYIAKNCNSGSIDNSKVAEGLRFTSLYDKLTEINPDYVFFEDVKFARRPSAFKMQAGFRSIVILWCERNFVPYIYFSVQQVKKQATGFGGGPKSDKFCMKKEAIKLGFKLKTEPKINRKTKEKIENLDEVDAFWVLITGLKFIKLL